jgi:hypothetical protein
MEYVFRMILVISSKYILKFQTSRDEPTHNHNSIGIWASGGKPCIYDAQSMNIYPRYYNDTFLKWRPVLVSKTLHRSLLSN